MGKNTSASNTNQHSIEAMMIVGGSGFIGSHLARKLSANHRSVVSIYHRRLPEPLAHVYPVCSDLSSIDLLAAPLRGVKTVYYLAWENNFINGDQSINFDGNLENVSPNLKMLNNLLRAMEKANSERIVFLSALGAGRRAQTTFLQEKYLAEFAVINSKIPQKIILRSGLVFGSKADDDPFIQSIAGLMKFPGFYPVPKMKEQISPIHINDLISVLIKLGQVELSEQVALLEITGSESLSVAKLFKMVSDRYAKGARMPLHGKIGAKLLPIFERSNRSEEILRPKVKDYLAIGHQVNDHINEQNPLAEILPDQFLSINEALGRGKAFQKLPQVCSD